jgi:GAF domain-containing protein/CheY-like chemotaxis protein
METTERILVVEDSEEIISFLKESILDPSGYDTLTARDGQEGLRRALEEQPDLILLDLNLPRMTGMEVLQVLHDRGSDIPVILMTFYGSEEIAVEAFRQGVKNYIIKPFKPQEVLEAIESALSEGRLRREKEVLTGQLVRTNKQLEQQVRELTMLYDITQAMAALLDLETLLSRVVEASVFLSKADEGMLFLMDEETGELYLRAAKGIGEKYARGLRLPVDDSLIGRVVTSGEALRIASSEARLDLKVKTGYMVNSLLYVPLRLRGGIRGVLGVSNRVTDRAFTRADQHRLNVLADQAIIAMENARLYDSEHRRAFQLAMTSHMSQRMSSILELDALLAEIVELLKQNFGYHYAQVLLHDEPGYLTMYAGTGDVGQTIRDSLFRAQIDDQTVVGWVAQNEEPLRVDDLRAETRFSPHELLADTLSELALPLRTRGEVIGVLDIHSDQRKAFEDDDEVVLQMLADHIAIAIQNATSYESLKRRAGELAHLNEIATAITSALDADEILKRVMIGVSEVLRVEAGSLLLVDEAGEELEFKVTMHGRTEKLAPFRLKMGQGIAGWVAERGEPALVDDVREDPRYYSKVTEAIGFEARSILCVPVKFKDRTIGVIEVVNKLGEGGDTRFSQDDLEMLTALAASISVALENARLHEARKKQITDALGETLKTFATNTYALKMSAERGNISCVDESLAQLLDSMERGIEQMASLTKILGELASPESTAEDLKNLKQRLETLRAKYSS